MEYRFDKENLGKPAAEEETEIARRQQFWLDNNVDDLARLYKARIREEEFDFEDEVDDDDGLDWEDGGDDGFGAPAKVGGRDDIKAKALALRERLKSIFDGILSKKIPNVMFPFGKVSKRTVDKVLELTSNEVNLDGYEHVISSNSVYHAQKRGHFEGRNYADSLPLTNEDLLRVGDVVENWNDITYRKRKNADTITYQKTYPDGTVLYVEEILNGDAHGRPKRLASKSIYKRKAESSTDTAEASRYNVQDDESPQPFNGVQSENLSESQGKKSGENGNNSFGSSGGGRMERSTDPYPPDLTMPKDGRFDPKRVDSSARKDYDASAAQEAFDGVWDSLGDVKRGYSPKQIREVEAKMRDFTKKMDARMLELPELIEFAERIIRGKVRAVKGFKGDYLGMYYGGEKKIELRRDLFKLVGDCRRYEVALDAARDVLKKHGFDEEVVDSRRPDQIVQAVYENRLGIEYQTAFERKINVEFGKAKRGGEPSAALMVAAHEIMHAVDDIRADGSRLGKHSGGTLGAIVGEIPKCLTAVSKIRGWGDVLTPEIRKSISKCADFAAGKRPKNPEKLKEWRKYRNDYRQKEFERFCAENRILTREVAVKELNEVIAWWQGLPSADMVGKYFQQPWERFAEAGAAFLCNTKMFAKLAPNVYEAMLGNMRARPKFWQNWQEFQRRLDNPQGNARRTAETVKSGFVEARLADVEYAKSVRKADLAYLRQDLKTYYRTENAPLYDLAEKLAKRNGGRAYDAYGLIADFHDYRYAATFQEAYMARVARVYEKLAQNKIDLDDFDAALLCLRIDQGRADIANPYGITPKRARKKLRCRGDAATFF